jgi:hypothetical protein
MLQLSDYFKQFRDSDEIDDDKRKNAQILISKVSHLLSMIPYENPIISSGFRPSWYNKKISGSANSAHCFAMAIDIVDPTEEIGKWCRTNIKYLMENKLFMESLDITHKSEKPSGKWVHLTTRAPRSGNIIFLP